MTGSMDTRRTTMGMLSQDRWMRVAAGIGLAAMLAVAAPAAAQSDRAERTLSKMRASALASAIDDITSRNVDKRREAASELGRFDEVPDRVVPPLAAALADGDETVRRNAASSLWELGEAAAPAAEALRSALADPSPAVRVRAAGALEAVGVDPAELVPARRSVVAEGDWFDRALAVRDLIGSVDAAELAAPLVAAIRETPDQVRHADPDDRFSGVAVLAPLAATGSPGVAQPLMAALTEPGMPRVALVAALAPFEPEPEGWVETLVRLSRDPDPELREAVASALELRAKRPEGGAGWPAQVLGLLGDADRDVRWRAVMAFGAAGGHAAAGVPAIARIAASSGDEDLRASAVRALGAIGDASEPFDRAVKAEVAAAAGPALLAVVDDAGADDDLRRDAMDAYTRLALEPEVAVRELSRIAGGDYPEWVRIVAARGFWPLGRAAEPALPVLERLSEDPDELVAAAATSAIDDIRRGVAVTPPAAAAPSGAGDPAAQAWLRQQGRSYDQDGFYRAMVEGDADAVERYLAAGMSAADAGTTGMPPLHSVVMFGCPWGQATPESTLRIVAALVASGADPNAVDELGNQVLHRAVSSCDGALIGRLLEAGADPRAANTTGMRPFGLAVATNAAAAEAFLAAGYTVTPEEAAQYAEWFTDDPAKRSLLERAGVK
jgi:HEAT repeat protein